MSKLIAVPALSGRCVIDLCQIVRVSFSVDDDCCSVVWCLDGELDSSCSLVEA